MAINLNDNIGIIAPKPTEVRYLHPSGRRYINAAEVNSIIEPSRRFIDCIVSTDQGFFIYDGGTEDSDLVPYATGGGGGLLYSTSTLEVSGNTVFRLNASDSSFSDIKLLGGDNMSVSSVSGDTIVFSAETGELGLVDEGNGIGYRIKNRNTANYGNIGLNSIDLSTSLSASTVMGATGDYSFVSGLDNISSGIASHAEGNDVISSGYASHAEGSRTTASGDNSHAEGEDTIASGDTSHAEGNDTIASGVESHSQGKSTFARAFGEHSGGIYGTDYSPLSGNTEVNSHPTDRLVNYGNGLNTSNRDDAFTLYKNGAVRFYRNDLTNITNTNKEGLFIYDSSNNNRPTIHNGTDWKGLAYLDDIGLGGGSGQLEIIDEGNGDGYALKNRNVDNYGNIGLSAIDLSTSLSASTTFGATGDYSFVSGRDNTASGQYSNAEGFKTNAIGDGSHAEGFETIANGINSHTEGSGTTANGQNSHAEGDQTTATGTASHAQGNNTVASGINSHAEGNQTIASGDHSHAEGDQTTATGTASHAQGSSNVASGSNSHAEGRNTTASGQTSHAEGDGTTAGGLNSHAEGFRSETSGNNSHAEGNQTIASGDHSHAEGQVSIASGFASHAEGLLNFARSRGEHSGGVYGTDYTPNNNNTDRLVNYGNGTNSTSNRDDAFTIYKNGAVRFYRTTTTSIGNSNKEGLLIFDSNDNNRPTIHDGTEWKGLAYSGEVINSYVDFIDFEPNTGVLTLFRNNDLPSLSADLDGRYVDLSNNQTINGEKTFNEPIIINSDAITSTRENILKAKVSDNNNDTFIIANGTTANSRFIPTFVGYTEGTYESLIFRGLGDAVNDITSSEPYVTFKAANTNNSSDPNNGVLNIPINRDLFSFGSNNTYMLMTAGGRVLLGNTLPSDDFNSALQTSGNIKADGFVNRNSDNTYVLLGGGGTKLLSDFVLSGGVNTTYSTSVIDSSGDAVIRLSGSDSSTDDVTLVAGENTTLNISGDSITIDSSDSGQLIAIDEGNGTGYVIKDIDRTNFEPIGDSSINLALYSPTLTSSTINTYGVKGFGSFATGANHSIDGGLSFAAGGANHIEGNYSSAFGFLNSISGDTSIIFGARNESNGSFSASFGNLNISTGDGSATLGIRTIARSAGEIVVGTNSYDIPAQSATTVSSSDVVFHVGASADQNNRRSQLMIFKSGLIKYTPINVKNITFNPNVPNGIEGMFGLDNQNNNRPTIHNGTEWKELAYVDEISGGSGATYNLNVVSGSTSGVTGGNTIIRLSGSDSSTDDVTLVAGDNITLDTVLNEITINAVNVGSLVPINEGNGIGYIISGRDDSKYGNVGFQAKDLSFSNNTSNTRGATGTYSFASNSGTTASGFASYAEGIQTVASNEACHAEGSNTVASGTYSHAEGIETLAGNFGSHAEGFGTEAIGANSHAEGANTVASGPSSHVQGIDTFARAVGEHSGGVFGTDYVPLSGVTSDPTDRLVNYGNGVNDTNRDDAFTIYRNGAVRFYRNALTNINNTDKEGFFIFDSDNNNRPTIHNGTEWRSLAYEEVTAENGNANGTVDLDINSLSSIRLSLTSNTTLTTSNEPTSGYTKTINVTATSNNNTETLTLPASWNVYGSYDPATRNKLTIEFANFPTSGLEVDCFINQPNP